MKLSTKKLPSDSGPIFCNVNSRAAANVAAPISPERIIIFYAVFTDR